jgi:purine-binding chemotaxis protein CheW
MTKNNPHAGLFLICRSAGYLCAIPLGKITEIMRPLPLERIPDPSSDAASHLPTCLIGASVIRGTLMPVISLARLLGAESTPARFISIKLGGRAAALAVDEVNGIHQLEESGNTEISPLLQALENTAVGTIATLDNELLLILQAARLIPENVWAAMNGQAAP